MNEMNNIFQIGFQVIQPLIKLAYTEELYEAMLLLFLVPCEFVITCFNPVFSLQHAKKSNQIIPHSMDTKLE